MTNTNDETNGKVHHHPPHHDNKHSALHSYKKPILALAFLGLVIILSILNERSKSRNKPLVDFSFKHHYTIQPEDVQDGKWIRVPQGVIIDRSKILQREQYVSFWATHGKGDSLEFLGGKDFRAKGIFLKNVFIELFFKYGLLPPHCLILHPSIIKTNTILSFLPQ